MRCCLPGFCGKICSAVAASEVCSSRHCATSSVPNTVSIVAVILVASLRAKIAEVNTPSVRGKLSGMLCEDERASDEPAAAVRVSDSGHDSRAMMPNLFGMGGSRETVLEWH